ncbi:MAG TPA: DUF1569 domain-containing protein [Chitinophagaceae bacterium]|nr:DUF1569 domain-containing protein [Chitinophagaceae bacterium]
MEVKNLFDSTVFNEIIERLHKLSPESQRQWGKMQVAQMLAHCKEAFKVPLTDNPLPRMFLGSLLGWMIKSKLYNASPWKQGLPTSPDFVIKDARDFEKEKTALLELMNKFHNGGPGGVGKYPHPFFGKFTSGQWGKMMWKHLDHHLRQFGA